tara:strand:+ start:385 stop:699 length:315 start_codon:yes stop_codon:yes gene_type:complete
VRSISQIFKGNEHLMDLSPVEVLIEYTQELEGQVFEKKIQDNYDKEHMLKSMLQDILSSCRDMEDTNQLADRYPGMYDKTDAESLVKNLKIYILDMSNKNNLGI